MSVDSDDDVLPPGIHRVDHADPAELAGQVGAVHLRTISDVESAIEDHGPRPAVDDDRIAELRELARRIELAQRVASRTRERSADAIAGRLEMRSSAVTIHPDALRNAASVVGRARADVDAARRALQEHREEQDRRRFELESWPVADEPEETDTTERDEQERAAAEQRRARMRRARTTVLGALAVALGAGLVAIGVGLLPAVWALMPTFAVAVWGSFALKRSVADIEVPDVDEESSNLLDEVASATDQLFEERAAALAAMEDRSPQLEVRLTLAEEELRVAERNWHELAGADADPDDVDAVVRRFDPQHQEAVVLATQTATVRAASTLLDRAWKRWEEAWTGLGLGVPAAEDAAAAVARLEPTGPPSFVCSHDASVLAEELASALPSAVVLVVEPQQGGVVPDDAVERSS